MEGSLSDSDMGNLVNSLVQGKELARQLQIHLKDPPSHENTEVLLREIMGSFDHSLSVLMHRHGGTPPEASGSPRPLTPSLRSNDSTPVSKKTKAVERWTQTIRVNPGTGVDGQLDDRYSWRKYGQKDIQGFTYPRSYYRCAYRQDQGCMAVKQTQRTNDDASMFKITFRGSHSCNPIWSRTTCNLTTPITSDSQSEEKQPFKSENLEEPFINIQTSLRVITSQDSFLNKDPSTFSSLPATLSPDYNQFFSDNDDFHASYLHVSNGQGLFHNLNTTESELNRVVSSSFSASSSAVIDVDFPSPLSFEFGSNFSFRDGKYLH